MVGIIGDRAGLLGEKWRILDGKEGEWPDIIFGAPMW
jgi:hypothetical protein